MAIRYRLVSAAVLLASSGPALAQDLGLQPGDILFNGADQRVKVLECRAAAYGARECRTVGWDNGRAISNPAWWDEKMLVDGDARVRDHLGLAACPGSRAAVRPLAPRPTTPAARAAAAPRPSPVGDVPNGSYTCQIWMGGSYVNLGKVRSVAGKLTPNPLAKTGATITGVAPSKEGITVSYTTARGYRESMDCTRG